MFSNLDKRALIVPVVFVLIILGGIVLLFRSRVSAQSDQASNTSQTTLAAIPAYTTPPTYTPNPSPVSSATSGASGTKALPETGPSPVVWLLAGLLPLGLKLRKYGALVQEDDSTNGLWEERFGKKL